MFANDINPYLFSDMLKKVEGAQADILDKLRTDLEDSNKGWLDKLIHSPPGIYIFQTQHGPNHNCNHWWIIDAYMHYLASAS